MQYYTNHTGANYYEPIIDFFYSGTLIAVDVFDLLWYDESFDGVVYLN